MHKKNILRSIKCSYYVHAFSCGYFGKLQIILKISGRSVKSQFLMIFDALANIAPVVWQTGVYTKFCKHAKLKLVSAIFHEIFTK